jgi:hypothetical protein
MAKVAEVLHAGLPSDVDESLSTLQSLASNVDAGLDGRVALNDFIDDTNILKLKRYTTLSPTFQGNLFSRPFMISNSGCSLPRAFFNELVFQAEESSIFPRLKHSALVKLELYYEVTTSLPVTDIPSRCIQEKREVPPAKTRTILSIELLREDPAVGEENGIEGDAKKRKTAAQRGRGLRLLLCQGRECMHAVVSEAALTKRAWKEFSEECGRPADWWKGHF